MKYLDKKFSISAGFSKQYRENWAKAFGRPSKAVCVKCSANLDDLPAVQTIENDQVLYWCFACLPLEEES